MAKISQVQVAVCMIKQRKRNCIRYVLQVSSFHLSSLLQITLVDIYNAKAAFQNTTGTEEKS